MTDPLDLDFRNTSGLYELKFVDVHGVNAIPEVVYNSHQINGEITLNSGYSWSSLYFSDESAGFSEEEQPNKGESHWEMGVEIFIPHSNHDQIYIQQLAVNKRYILDMLDRDENRRLIGTLKEPMTLTAKYSTQKGVGKLKGTMLKFAGLTAKRAYFYDPNTAALTYSSGSGS